MFSTLGINGLGYLFLFLYLIRSFAVWNHLLDTVINIFSPEENFRINAPEIEKIISHIY